MLSGRYIVKQPDQEEYGMIRKVRWTSTRPCILAVAVLLASSPAWAAAGKTATAEIQSCGEAEVSGSATLQERASEEGVKLVDIDLHVRGLPPGKHAVHIHEVGICDPCGAAKGHFDPGPNSNSNPDGNHPFHMGDLINLEVNEKGSGRLEATTSRITLSDGPLSLFDEDGSAFIIHVDPDTYCPEGVEKGCAGGARAACGIIRMGER
jgi:Cu-Zn family superoxide dismutase